MLEQFEANIVVDGDGLVVVAPGLEDDRVLGLRAQPAHGREDQWAIESLVTVFRHNVLRSHASPVELHIEVLNTHWSRSIIGKIRSRGAGATFG